MTTHDHEHDDLPQLDARASAAADGLRRHVQEQLDADLSVTLAPPSSAPARRGRLLAVAAACALLAGAVAVLSQQTDDDRTRVEVDEDGVALPDLEPGVLRPLGPRDGKDSVRLPVTAEPSTGLRDGDVVHVSSPGFEPGEQVGIVQCAREAGGDAPEARGGVDGCDLGQVEYADADQDGVASGSSTVRRVLTTPLTGTVDCAAEADRCIIAMGAVSDYDRSGGHALEFAPAAEPVDIPTVTVSPSEDLVDGDIVHVAAEGLTPDSFVSLGVCSSDPQVCWQTGEGIDVTETEGGEEYINRLVGLRVDGDGRLEGDVPVWRFLPGDEPGTYVDCAVSRCSLRFDGDTAPPTVPLGFTGGGDGPVPPRLAVDPSVGLAVGDEVMVRGAGFAPGTRIYLSLCAGGSGAGAYPHDHLACGGGNQMAIDEGGTFSAHFEIPELGYVEQGMSEECSSDGVCTTSTAEPAMEVRCDESTPCYVIAETYSVDRVTPPIFPPAPVLVTFR